MHRLISSDLLEHLGPENAPEGRNNQGSNNYG